MQIEIANNNIKESDKSISEIAFLCGFSDSSYYSKILKKIMMCSPKDYKNKIKNI